MKKVNVDSIIKILNNIDDIHITDVEMDNNLINIGMNSISFIRVVTDLEEEFECEIPDSKLQISNMDTLQKIIDLLENLYEESSHIGIKK